MEGSKKAILLDIDGIICDLLDRPAATNNGKEERGVAARTMKELVFIPGLGPGLDKLVELGWLILGHTNQPDVARKKFTNPNFLQAKHAAILAAYPQFVSVDRIFVCPHTETDLCSCRKPKPGLLTQAAAEHGLDLSQCWVVGDSPRDIEAGKIAGCLTLFVQTKWNFGSLAIIKATAVAKSTACALELIRLVETGQHNTEDLN